MARVTLEKVTKIYPGNVRAVAGIDLAIADKEFVVLVGPSGCGKTTTLRMIAGLEEITSGTIRIGERVVNDVPPKDRDIAMVFQNYALYPHMTVYNNMAFGLMLREMPGFWGRLMNLGKAREIRRHITERVQRAAEILEIGDLLDRKPKVLSGGQQQRVAVGRAIVREPAAFLFDEPLSNLDAKLRVTTRAELKRLHQRLTTTTIYVTHDQEEAMTLGDRIVVMREGVIQQADTPLASYNQPRNRFVAGFIGMPPMNFFDGAIRVVDGQLIFEEGSLNGKMPPHPNPLPRSTVGEGIRGGELTLPGNGFKLMVPVYLRQALEGRVGRHVVLGIRPEHFHLKPVDGDGASSPIEMSVNVVEPLGNDMDVYMQTNLTDRVVARVEASAAQVVGLRSEAQRRATFHADLRRVHFFEPGDAGMNLSLSQGYSNEPAHAHA
jgi:multiple sugar transport system ATP-binding protein